MKRLRDFIFWTLNTRVSPLAYLAAYSSLAIGFFWTFFRSLPDIQNTLIYKEGLVIGDGIWGVSLFVGSILLACGLKLKKKPLVRWGSMINFVMWCFAAGLYLSHEYWYAFFAFALAHMLTQGYFFLASSLDSLWNNDYNR
jgi:hypothetical protein